MIKHQNPEIHTGQWTNTHSVYYTAELQEWMGKINQHEDDATIENQHNSINFWQLDNNMRANLDTDFCLELFNSCSMNGKEFASMLGCSYPYLIHLKNNYYSIPISYLKIVSEQSGIGLSTIQSHVLEVRSRAGVKIKNIFPLSSSTKIASLVGHVFGDGYIGRNKSQFEYCNDNQNLLSQVENDVFQLFAIRPFTRRRNRIGFPVVIGKILAKFGAPYAPKIFSTSQVPAWIKSNTSFSRAFIKAFFDDDGSVMYSPAYNAKGLNLHVIRHEKYKDKTLGLLNEIKTMLEKFNVYSGKPKISKRYTRNEWLN